MSRYIKFYSNYVLKKRHQLVNDGTIFERDWVTVGGVNRMTPGQTPVYSNGNFIITVGSVSNSKKRHKFGNWVQNGDSDEWTYDDVSRVDDGLNSISFNNSTNDLRDYAYFGSCVELIRASIENIIKYFPAELYFSSTPFFVDENNVDNPFTQHGNVVNNYFGIDLVREKTYFDEGENKLRYFLGKYDENTFVYEHYSIINGDEIIPIESVELVRYNNVDCKTSFNDAKITINGTYEIDRWIIGSQIVYASSNSPIGMHIRPNEEIVNDFFNNLDDFEEVLLNLKSSPIYSNNFLTPIETDKGISYVERKYTWPIVNGWNLDINSFAYEEFISSLTDTAQKFDDINSDNIYRAMTHEAIKNFDWTYTRDYYYGEEEKYVIGGTKIMNLLRIYGRILDNLKRYIDGIKNTNVITYNGENNSSDYFLTDKLSNYGWVVTDILIPGSESNTTDSLYSGVKGGYKYSEVRNEFYKRLILCSKRILQSKGTINSIHMIFSMFGIPKEWYTIKEYYSESNFIEGTELDTIKTENQNKKFELLYSDDEYSGLLAKEFNINGKERLYPYFDKNKVYDGDVYFQMYGGWMKKSQPNNGLYDYTETMTYLNMVNRISDLFLIPLIKLKDKDVYYVNDISDLSEYNVNTVNATHYFRLVNLNMYRNISGWENIKYVNGEIEDPDIIYLENIINDNTGNNPHVGYGLYDSGNEYFEYYKNLFHASSEKEPIGFTLNEKNGHDRRFKIKQDTYENCLKYVNSKVIEIYNNRSGNLEYNNYFNSYILPYIKQVIPSTSIVIINGFDDKGGKYISLSKSNIKLNDSCNPIESAEVNVYSSDDFSFEENGFDVSKSGNTITVKKKDNSVDGVIKIFLTENPEIFSYLYVSVSKLSISEDYLNFDIEGGTQTIQVDTEDDGFGYYCSEEWISFSNDNNSLILYVSNNTDVNDRTSSVRVYNNNDANAFCLINVEQKGVGIGITCYGLYENEDGGTAINSIPGSGGTYFIKVNAVGGSNDFNIVSSNNKVYEIYKLSNNIAKIIIYNNESGIDISSFVEFCHKDDTNIKCKLDFIVKKDEELNIFVNNLKEDSVNVPYSGGEISKKFYIEAIGGSREWILNDSEIPSDVSYIINVNEVTFSLSSNQTNSEKSYKIYAYHKDDKSIKALININQSGIGERIIVSDPTLIDISSEGGVYFSNVKVYGGSKNFSFSYNCSSWVTVTKVITNQYSDFNEYRLTFNTIKNSSDDERECDINLMHSDDLNVTDNIKLTQSSKNDYSIEVRRDGILVTTIEDVEYSGEEIPLNVIISPEGSEYVCNTSASWVNVDVNGDISTVRVSKNNSQYERSCKLTFVHGLDSNLTYVVNIIQNGTGGLDINVSKTNSNFTKEISISISNSDKSLYFYTDIEGGDEKYKIDTYRTSSWLLVGNLIGGNGIVNVTVDGNSDYSNRNGKIVLLHNSNNDISAIVNVTQIQGIDLKINPSDGDEKTYTINTYQGETTKVLSILAYGGNATYSYGGQNVNWVLIDGKSLSSISNYKNSVVNLTILSNNTGVNRSCELTFYHDNDNSKKVRIIINQKIGDYSITVNNKSEETWDDISPEKSEKKFSVEVKGGSRQYKVKEIRYTAGDFTGWVTTMVENDSITLKLQENIFDGEKREAEVVLCHADKNELEAIIYIKQKQAEIEYRNYKIDLVPSSTLFSSEGGSQLVYVTSTRDKYINNEYVSTENVPFKITIEDDGSYNVENIFTVDGESNDFTIEVDAYGESKTFAVISKLKNTMTGDETFVVWTASASDNSWISISPTTNRLTANFSANETNSNRTGYILFKQDKEDAKQIRVTITQKHVEQNVKWNDPLENSINEIPSNELTFTAYADTTALTYNDIEIFPTNNEDWVTISNISQGERLYGTKSVKADITILKNNNGEEREVIIKIKKK